MSQDTHTHTEFLTKRKHRPEELVSGQDMKEGKVIMTRNERGQSFSISPREDFGSSELSSLLKKVSSLFKNYQVYLKQIPTLLFTSVNNTFIVIFTLIIKWAKIHQNTFPCKNIQVYLNSYILEMFKYI